MSTKIDPWLDCNAKPYVQIENVSKKFGDFVAIDGLNLDIFKNEFFSLLGPSGCGKTTLLRLLAGFETVSSGRILLDGEDISNVPPYIRPINMMFQSYALFPHMSVEKNIAFGLKQDKLADSIIKKKVNEILELVELTELAKRKPHQLSGGQKQRVALARSLVKKPKLLLLDEPLGALDKRLKEQTQFELMNIQEELGITFIIVTHDQEEAMTVSTRIAVMGAGKLNQVATPTQLYEIPANREVANFIGDINIFNATYCASDKFGSQLKCEEFAGVFYVNQKINKRIGSKLWFALRPEKLEVHKQLPDTKHNVLKGKIEDIGYGGSFSTYHIRFKNNHQLIAIRANRERTKEHNIVWGDDVYVYWEPSSVIVLFS